MIRTRASVVSQDAITQAAMAPKDAFATIRASTGSPTVRTDVARRAVYTETSAVFATTTQKRPLSNQPTPRTQPSCETTTMNFVSFGVPNLVVPRKRRDRGERESDH